MTAVLERPEVLAAIEAIIGPAQVLTGDAMLALATDVYRRAELPLAVVRPGSVEELQAVVRAAAGAGTRLSLRGGGASYTDGYIPFAPGMLLLDLARLDRIVRIDAENGHVTVEAGVTWAALRDALAEQDLRTPFWGPFSGLAATVGGSMSQNTISHGSGAYGISAESVLSYDVVTADGSLLSTGAAAAGAVPFTRHFGPDLTGLFSGDCGTLGIKARVTLPVIRRRLAHRPISFAFADLATMHEAMRRVAIERIEDTHFSLDGALSQGQIARQDRAGATLDLALSILRSSPSLVAGARQLVRAATSARRAIGASAFMVHYIVEGFDDAEVKARLHRIRTLVLGLGREIPATVPAVVRGMPFAPLFNTLGPAGERWVPLHGILPNRNVAAFERAYRAMLADRAAEMERLGIWLGGMFATVGSGGFLYEIAMYWPDAITEYHRAAVPADYLNSLPVYPPNPEARAYVHQLKADIIALFVEHGATNFQLGKAYPYASRLQAEPLALVRALKAALDPGGLLSPGNLGL
ncbi:FAD-binding oxidoreductase [Sphingomonas pokkalii]|uniref:FAD-binding oxidoreductase n=1 Tax=Sphingomonas pokkalii TaxID=2175090 RepID=A0A2U0SH78_9SPHN|nr:FAD-binding oxidoreductase [Sphingomonas pokkalii]PVX30712.1 FAD-binding oxidoreductase [Sphingomonas pokkalii]